jgi:uncharacterized protein YkwD
VQRRRLWLLAFLAGLIWLAILFQRNAGRLTTISPTAPEIGREIGASSAPTTDPVITTDTPPAIPMETRSMSQQMKPVTPALTSTLVQIFHEVQPGEAPGIIAETYGIRVDLLLTENDITDPTTLQIGQRLRIPVTATPTPVGSPTPTRAPTTYTIQPGDVLLEIAVEYDTTVEAIMIANEITDPRTLQIGQVLIIPPDRGSILGVPTEIHEIESGDTLLGLAMLYGSTLEDILVTNPDLEPERLQLGQKIVIPLTQPKSNPNANPTLPRVTSPIIPPSNLTRLEQDMADAVNEVRQANGLSPLTIDEQLTLVARAHGQDMVARGYFSHVTPEGITLDGRLEEHGLTLNWTGENIQRNVQPRNETVRYATNWFMNSRPHRQNILHPRYDRLGISVSEGPPNWYTFVLVFAGD